MAVDLTPVERQSAAKVVLAGGTVLVLATMAAIVGRHALILAPVPPQLALSEGSS